MATTATTPAAETVSKLLQDPFFISSLTEHVERIMAAAGSEEWRASTVEELLQAEEDRKAGHLETTPWEEVRAKYG